MEREIGGRGGGRTGVDEWMNCGRRKGEIGEGGRGGLRKGAIENEGEVGREAK